MTQVGGGGTALVTGANGFIGAVVAQRLLRDAWRVRGSVRTEESGATLVAGVEPVVVGEVGPHTDWSSALNGVAVVVHLAGRAHVMRETVEDPLEEFRRVNTLGTERLAREAVQAGVGRLVLVSSIGVNGRSTRAAAFTEADPPAPASDYALSKLEAERALLLVVEGTAVETVIIRPTLVYGPGMKGNLARLLWLVESGLPLPLGDVRNRRSLIAVENLADLLALCAAHPAAAGELFLAADGGDVSTPELICALARGLDRPARLLPVPVRVLEAAGRLTGRLHQVEQLCGSLHVDASHARQRLGWRPRVLPAEGLRRTGAWYREAGDS